MSADGWSVVTTWPSDKLAPRQLRLTPATLCWVQEKQRWMEKDLMSVPCNCKDWGLYVFAKIYIVLKNKRATFPQGNKYPVRTCTASVYASISVFFWFFLLIKKPQQQTVQKGIAMDIICTYRAWKYYKMPTLYHSKWHISVVWSGSTLYEIQTNAVTVNNSKQTEAEGASSFSANVPAFHRTAQWCNENEALYGLRAAIARIPF